VTGPVAGRLELASYDVSDVRLGARTGLSSGVLEICADELRERLADPVLADVRVELARPGEATRIVHLLDTVEPRVRLGAAGSDFPGLLGPPLTVGEGRTNRLAGVAVMETAALPLSLGGLNVKEAILDMAGPGAALTPFSRTLNVVLAMTVRDGFSYAEYDAAIRRAGLKAAVYLGETTRGAPPDRVERFALGAANDDLPRIAYVCLLMQEGDVHHMFVYGRSIDDTPSLLHPNECLDGAIVSGDHHMAAHRNPTYLHQNNPVVRELYRRHGGELAFCGVVVSKCLNESFFGKQRTAAYAAKLARLLGAQGVVITAGTSGHGVADLMLHCEEAERAGLRAALTCFEMAGDSGTEFGFVTFSDKADAVVSTGNMDEVVELPPMDRVIGGDTIIDIGNYEGGGGAPAGGRLKTALRRLYCCASLVGPGHMTAQAG
jgi:glycine reductase